MRRGARPTEHLSPPEPDRSEAVDGSIEVTVQVGVALLRTVVPHPAVELDDLSDRVRDVAVQRAGGRVQELALSDRKSVRTLDEGQVAVLEDRACPLAEVDEHVSQEGPTGDPLA